MKSLYQSYIRCFVKSAEALLDNSSCYKEIVPFANFLNAKANQLLLRALSNKTVDIQHLQRELFETGREYIRKFVSKFNQNKMANSIQANLVVKKYDPNS